MTRSIHCLLISILFIAVNPLFAQKQNEFTIRQTIDYAMKNATAIQNALLDIKIQQQTNRELTAIAFPQLNSSISVNDFVKLPTSLVPAEFTGGAPGTYFPIQFGTKYNVTAGFDLNQLIFDGQVFVGLQARKDMMEFSSRQADVTMEMVKVNIYKIYYQLLVGNKQMGSIDANIERFEKLLRDTREIFKNGFAEKLDIDKVSVQLNNLQTEKLRLQSQLDAGNAGLKFLINMPQAEVLALTDSLSEEKLNDILINDSIDYNNIKEYRLYATGYRLAGYNVRRYQLSAYPTLSFFANYNQNAFRPSFDFLKGGNWYGASFVGLRVQMPISNGNIRQSRLQKAKIELQKTENSFNQLKESINTNVVQATLRINAARITIDAQKKNMQLAEQVFQATKLKYEQGLGSQQEIYTAEAELKMAQNNYYSALYDAIIAAVDYRKSIGKLN